MNPIAPKFYYRRKLKVAQNVAVRPGRLAYPNQSKNTNQFLVYHKISPVGFLKTWLPEDAVSLVEDYLGKEDYKEWYFSYDGYETPSMSNVMSTLDWTYVDVCAACSRQFHREHWEFSASRRCPRHRHLRARHELHTTDIDDLLEPYRDIKHFDVSPTPREDYFNDAMLEFCPHASIGGSVFDTGLAHRDWFGVSKTVLETCSKNLPSFVKGKMMDHVENLLLLFGTLSGCNTPVSAVSAIMTYAKTHFKGSIFKMVSEYLSALFMTPQALADTVEMDCTSFSETMAKVRNDWRSVVDSKFFSHISRFLGIIVLGGVCDASSVTMQVNGIKILEPDLMKQHHNAIDFMDAAMSTITYFVENTYVSWKTRSLAPMLFGVKFGEDLTTQYQKCLTWWSLAQNGNLERQEGISDTDFYDLLHDTGTKLKLLEQESRGIDKTLVERKLLEIAKITSDFILMKLGSRMRKAPFVIQLYGSSAQGKSTIMDQLVQAMLVSAGLDTDPRRRGNINASDQFMSTWLSNMIVAVIDDFGNENPDTVKYNPCRLLLDVCNNAVYIANKADLHQKGKVFVEPDIVIITTNVLHLNAAAFSMCPYAIQRRPDLVFEVKAKKKFQSKTADGVYLGLDSSKVSEWYDEQGIVDRPEIEDIWVLTLLQCVRPKKETSVGKYITGRFGGQLWENRSLLETLPHVLELFHKHRKNQERIVANSKKKSKLRKCGIDGCIQLHGYCPYHFDDECQECDDEEEEDEMDEMEPHFGEKIGSALSSATSLVQEKVTQELCGLDSFVGTGIETGVAVLTLSAARRFCWHTRWLQLVPTPWVQTELFQNAYLLTQYDRMKRYWLYGALSVSTLVIAGCALAISTVGGTEGFAIAFAIVCVGTVLLSTLSKAVKAAMVYELRSQNIVSDAVKRWRDEHGGNVCKAAAIVAAMYGCAKVYRALLPVKQRVCLDNTVTDTKSALQNMVYGEPEIPPEDPVEEAEPPITVHGGAVSFESHQEDNVWAKVERTLPYPTDTLARTASPTQLLAVIDKNLFSAALTSPEGRVFMADILFITSNVFVLPRHYFEKSATFEIEAFGRNPEKSGGRFKTSVSLATSYHVPTKDLVFCYSPTGGSFKNITKHLPDTTCQSAVPFRGIYRRKDGTMLSYAGKAAPQLVTNNCNIPGITYFRGGLYEFITIPTFEGMCGAPIVSERIGSKIMGIHVGGLAGTPKGCYLEILQTDAVQAIAHLKAIPGVSITTQMGEIPNSFLGKTYRTQGELSARSPLMYMPSDACISYHGNCIGRVQPRTNVKVTPISKDLGEICDVPNVWGGPKVRPSWEPYQKCLSNMAVPCKSFPPDLVVRSVKDYSRDIVVKVSTEPKYRKEHPLTEKENLNGIPGKKFIDAMVLKTSAGFPFSGKKTQFIQDMDDIGNRKLTPEAMSLVEEAEGKLRSGERSFGIAKACTKDEVLPVAKGKCRIFYSSAFTTIYLARKYYLPVLRVLQLHPDLSECAVGANCHGPDWESLMDFAHSKGKDRLIAGDYSKYDQKLPTQLLTAALTIMVDIARNMDYSEEDLTIMENLIGDLVFPLINFNGELISLIEGGWISGVPMTVHVNGICGSLLLRNVFFQLYPEADEFRPCVSLLTYGDDNIGSVAKGYEKFNIKSISETLAPYGMVYTMPDKESELVEFMRLEEIEFLKRFSVYIPEIKRTVGALCEDSIFKSLHCYVANKHDDRLPAERCGEVIDGALREWFFHGRAKFERRQKEISTIVDKHGLYHHVSTLDLTYDERACNWTKKYDPRSSTGEKFSSEVTNEPNDIGYIFEPEFDILSDDCLSLEDDRSD